MRIKTLLLTATLASLSAVSAQAQFVGGTVVTSGPGYVTYGSSPVFAPGIGPVVGSPYTVVAPTSRVIVGGPRVIYSAPTPLLVPRAYPIVRPGWGPRFYGPVGPRGWGRGWRGW